jgi:hypothetical protein
MGGLQWAQEVAEARIQRQLEFADALDAKAGILFAYCGAVVIGAASLVKGQTQDLMWVAIGAAGLGLLLTVTILWPRTYWDPPDAEKLEAHVREAKKRQAYVVEALLDQQMEAVSYNETVLQIKALALKAAIIFAVIATAFLGLEVGQGRGQ